MIDWLKFEIPLIHDSINDGSLVRFNADGTEDWKTDMRLRHKGSFESSLLLKSVSETKDAEEQGHAQWLLIDGNPTKYLQGHNIDGIEDLIKLALITYENICEHIPQLYSDFAYQQVKKGDFNVYRIDINHMFDLGSDHNVEAWLHAAEYRASGRSGRAQGSKGTVYLQKGSSLWSIAMYNKYREITRGGAKHKIQDHTFYDKDKLIEFAEGLLRVEVRLLAKELKKRGLFNAKQLNKKLPELFDEYIRRCDMSANVELTTKQENDLPNQLIGTYYLWRKGRSVKDELPRATYFRHKKLFKEFNIDISIPPVTPEQSNVIPLLKVLEAKPVQRPGWLEDYIVK